MQKPYNNYVANIGIVKNLWLLNIVDTNRPDKLIQRSVWRLVAILSAFRFSLIHPNGLSFATGRDVDKWEGKIWLHTYAVRRLYLVWSKCIPIPP